MGVVAWGRLAPPIEFMTEEMTDAFSQIVMLAHTKVRKHGACFDVGSSNSRRELSVGKVRSVVQSTFVSIMGCKPRDRFQDIFDQASYFATHMALDHIFSDGNKRTALIMALVICQSFGHVDLVIDDNPNPYWNELYRWIKDVVSREKSESELADVLRSMAEPPKGKH